MDVMMYRLPAELAQGVKMAATGAVAVVSGFCAPLLPYAGLCSAMIALDCYTAVQLGRRLRRKNPRMAVCGRLSSRRFGRVVGTLARVYAALAFAGMMQNVLFDGWNLAQGFDCVKFVTGAVCFWQLLSVLENESTCSGARWARVARRFLVDKTERHIGVDIDGQSKPENSRKDEMTCDDE